MDIEQKELFLKRFKIIRSIGEEVIQDNELFVLLKQKKQLVVYDGFEPSGRMHIAHGLLRAINVNKYLEAGCKFKFWIADWFALINKKLGGDLKKIRKAGKLMIETWKVCGMDVNNPNIEFIWSSDAINAEPNRYWLKVFDIASKFKIDSFKNCTEIMGKNIGNNLFTSELMYPVMQTADVFFLGVDICSLGMDQKSVNMLCREYCDKIHRKYKPIIISHHMLLGLDGKKKMSKSDPNNAIFMNDSPQIVKEKIKRAFCEAGNIDVNPILEYVKYIILEKDHKLVIEEENGEKIYTKYDDIEDDFENKLIEPEHLKNTVIECLNRYLKPVRHHFATNNEANILHKTVKSYKMKKNKNNL